MYVVGHPLKRTGVAQIISATFLQLYFVLPLWGLGVLGHSGYCHTVLGVLCALSFSGSGDFGGISVCMCWKCLSCTF